MPAGPGAGEGQGDAFLSFTQELLFTMVGCLSQDALVRAMSSTGNYDATPAGLLAACLCNERDMYLSVQKYERAWVGAATG